MKSFGMVAVFVFVFFISNPRFAQTPIHPQCATKKDEISCSCALNNGGVMKINSRGEARWQSKRNKNDPVNEAFLRCMKASGR